MSASSHTYAAHAAVAAAPSPTPGAVASDFDFALPESLIAASPPALREQSRLLLLTEHASLDHQFAELPDLIARHVGDRALVVLNNTRVLAARLFGHKRTTDQALGGRVEFLLTEPVVASADTPPRCLFAAMYRCSKPLRPGQRVRLHAPDDPAWTHDIVVEQAEGGDAVLDLRLPADQTLDAFLQRLGTLPLPPYIERARQRLGTRADKAQDWARYQTVFAAQDGSVAAPTAGLHFTERVLDQIQQAGHELAQLTLHVGPGTFLPLRSERLDAHQMHAERYVVPSETLDKLVAAKRSGRPILAIGTTVTRTLEAIAPTIEALCQPGASPHLPTGPLVGSTQIFLHPPYRFRLVSALFTNFHLPRSTLLMLVCAFAGRDRTLAAYAHAIASRYRFFSFGDAMLIPRVLSDGSP